MSVRTLLALGLCAGVIGGGAAVAAPSKLPKAQPLTVTDAEGDANFSNDQGGLLPATPPSGPASRASADIKSVSLGRIDNGSVVKAMTVSMTLAAPPEQATQYRVAMSAPGCSVYYVEYQFPPAGSDAAITKGGLVRENCTGSSVFTDVDATITGNTIVWTLPVKAMPGDIKLGAPLEVKYGQTNLETAAVIPAFDAVTIGKPFKVGQ